MSHDPDKLTAEQIAEIRARNEHDTHRFENLDSKNTGTKLTIHKDRATLLAALTAAEQERDDWKNRAHNMREQRDRLSVEIGELRARVAELEDERDELRAACDRKDALLRRAEKHFRHSQMPSNAIAAVADTWPYEAWDILTNIRAELEGGNE